jgi:hypothetical protein
MRFLPFIALLLLGFPGACAEDSSASRQQLGFGGDVEEDGTQVLEHLASELTGAEERRIAVLREVLGRGLARGQVLFRESLAAATSSPGPSFELALLEVSRHSEELATPPDSCPFLKYYDNGWATQTPLCRELAAQGLALAFDQVPAILDNPDLPDYSFLDPEVPRSQLDFWYRRGVLGALSEYRVFAHGAMLRLGYCEAAPSPAQASYLKGHLVGRQELARLLNDSLKARGLAPDYPALSGVLDLCNPHSAILLPARLRALAGLGTLLDQQPLCAGYSPGTAEALAQYQLGQQLYEQGLRDGIADEASLATVRFFRRVPCAPLGGWWQDL